MSSAPPPESPDAPPPVAAPADASRFVVVRAVGSGGMATVYEVLDAHTGMRLAQKRLHPTPDAQRQRRMLELFEREFYTLSQISHPCVVQAFDYGVDERGAYYTMELLQGGEAQVLAPLPYKRACQIARDVCSALSLLHSRRLVYRDLNPRNVHCAPDGTAKLIDFGAITVMGLNVQIVGTPAYCAPEVVELQPLDARTDLYSLGATLYFLLTGQHVYPAKTFAQLRECWDRAPARPSELVPNIPAALDAMVMELLHLEPAARPANTGDVMEQFAVLSGQTVDEHSQVMQAYLSTPTLVGRESQLAAVRAKLQSAVGGHGSSLLLTSDSGVGRSRLLAACLTEAKLSGGLVLRAMPSELDGDYATIRALGASLFEASPEVATRAARAQLTTLAQLVPQLASSQLTPPQPAAAAPTPPERSQVLAALRDWFLAVSHERALIIAVDDLHRIDEPSAACLTWLARDLGNSRLLLLATREDQAHALAPSALKIFESHALHVPLLELTLSETEELLRSVFGNVPHVHQLALGLHAVAAGNPRDTMRLAQHLLDHGVARYRGGAWSLPASFDRGQLPDSMADALRREFEALNDAARALARLLSLASDRALSFEECVAAFPELPAKLVHDALQRLVQAQFVRLELELLTIAHTGLHATLQGGIDAEQRSFMQRKLAKLFARREHEEFRHAKHLLLAGDEGPGIDVLLAFSSASQQRTDSDPEEYVKLVRSMPEDWLEVFERAITCCEHRERKRAEIFRLRSRLCSLLNVLSAPVAASRLHLFGLIRQLFEDSGLDDYAALDPSIEASQRLGQALAAAKRRYEATPEAIRGLEPQLAIRGLARAYIWAAGMIAIAIDGSLYSDLPSIEAFSQLSPAINVIQRVVHAVGARVRGQHEATRAAYRQALERTAQPDRAGLDPSNHRFLSYGVMYGLAVIEAGMCLSSCRDLAETLAGEPLHAVNALQVAVLHDFWLGRIREADAGRAQIELRRVESASRQMADGTHLVWQTIAHAYCDDLTHVKQIIDELRPFAQRHPGWLSVVEYAIGEYHRIRGDFASAAEHLNAVLEATRAGSHQIWVHAAGTYLSVLCSLGRVEDAASLGEAYLQAAEQAELGYTCNYIRMPLAVALAWIGDEARAVREADSVIERFDTLGTTGINLALAYETRSRIALHLQNSADYEQFSQLCAEHCLAAGGRALRAKYDRLAGAARASAMLQPGARAAALSTSLLDTRIKAVLSECSEPRLRAERSLQLLLSDSGAAEGALYLLRDDGPVLAAHIGELSNELQLTVAVQAFVEDEFTQRASLTVSAATGLKSSVATTKLQQHVFILLGHQTSEGFGISGVAALHVRKGASYAQPGALAAGLSRMLSEHGDVVPRLVE